MKKNFLFLLIFIASAAYAEECELTGWDYWWNRECKGRIDVGPAFASIDMLESGHTKRTLDLPAVKIDATLMLYKGISLKPSFLIAWGKANLNSSGIGLGFCIPLTE